MLEGRTLLVSVGWTEVNDGAAAATTAVPTVTVGLSEGVPSVDPIDPLLREWVVTVASSERHELIT